eukprot:6186404-Pleurochrysis_carterae.AAC.1
MSECATRQQRQAEKPSKRPRQPIRHHVGAPSEAQARQTAQFEGDTCARSLLRTAARWSRNVRTKDAAAGALKETSRSHAIASPTLTRPQS